MNKAKSTWQRVNFIVSTKATYKYTKGDDVDYINILLWNIFIAKQAKYKSY